MTPTAGETLYTYKGSAKMIGRLGGGLLIGITLGSFTPWNITLPWFVFAGMLGGFIYHLVAKTYNTKERNEQQ